MVSPLQERPSNDVVLREESPRRGDGWRPEIVPGARLFRDEAVAAYLRGDEDGRTLRVAPPSTWRVFWAVASFTTVALVATCFLRADVTGYGRGILRASEGVQILSAQTSGLVAEIHARSGDSVRAGDVLARLDSAELKASLLEADRKLGLIHSERQRLEESQKHLFEEHVTLLGNRATLLGRRIESERETIELARKKLTSFESLGQKGYVSALQRDEAREDVAKATRELLDTQQESSRVNEAIDDAKSSRELQLFRLTQEAEEAQAKRDALSVALEQTAIVASRDGYVEAVLVRPGDLVQPGTPVGKLVPEGRPSQVVAFLPERDRAFLDIGKPARVEVRQLPVGEFGALHGHVTRIGNDLASQRELNETLGDGVPITEPVYRVEVALDDDAQAKRYASYLRPGILVDVRCALRDRRLITLVFDPLRAWLQ